MFVESVKMKIDVSSKHNVQAKKYDYVKIAFILNNVEGYISANQINYYFNQIFSQTYCNTQRIAQIIRSNPNLFLKSKKRNTNTDSLTYSFNGIIILNKTTQTNWDNKTKLFFRTP